MKELQMASLPGLSVASSPHRLLSAMVPHPCMDRSAMAATTMTMDGGMLRVMLMVCITLLVRAITSGS